jgi:putative ABC transport system ATP-binding protein
VLANEPTANLDSETGKRIIELLVGLRNEGQTVLIAEHDADFAANADAILEMSDRGIVSTSEG